MEWKEDEEAHGNGNKIIIESDSLVEDAAHRNKKWKNTFGFGGNLLLTITFFYFLILSHSHHNVLLYSV